MPIPGTLFFIDRTPNRKMKRLTRTQWIAVFAIAGILLCICSRFRPMDETFAYAAMLLNMLLIGCVRMSRRARVGNLSIFCLYNTGLLYGLFFRGAGGASLTWLFYLFLINGLQLSGLAMFAVIRKIRTYRQTSSR